ncbi:MAG: hypothetical protein KUG70_05745 [Rhodobacteraceae bacterium]|nr:hypothetical protein [Paracoccaceae bacterium]
MAQDSDIAADFPDDIVAIRKLRLANLVFNEVCEDLELMSRDLALFSEEERRQKQGRYLDVHESYQALREELVEFLRREKVTTDGR